MRQLIEQATAEGEPGVGRDHASASVDRAGHNALRAIPTGVTVVTALVGAEPWGTTVSACNVISYSPPMVLVVLGHEGRLAQALPVGGRFVVNVLAEIDEALARCFAGHSGPDARKRLCDAMWHETSSGLPALVNATATYECEVRDVVAVGGRRIVSAGIDAVVERSGRPLVTWRGRFVRVAENQAPSVGPTTWERSADAP